MLAILGALQASPGGVWILSRCYRSNAVAIKDSFETMLHLARPQIQAIVRGCWRKLLQFVKFSLMVK